MQNKKGISLIVLVITIIVMIILAAAIIISLNNTGIIGNANKAKDESNLANIKTAADLEYSEYILDKSVLPEGTTLGDYITEKLVQSGIIKGKNDDYYIVVDNDVTYVVQVGSMVDKYYKGEIKIGDYVSYDAGENSITLKEYTGEDGSNDMTEQDVTIKSTSSMKWQVLGASGNVLELVSEDVVNPEGKTGFSLYGAYSYLKGEEILNNACSVFGKGEGATKSRSMVADDIDKITGYDKTKSFGNIYVTLTGGYFKAPYGTKITYNNTFKISLPHYTSNDVLSGNEELTTGKIFHPDIDSGSVEGQYRYKKQKEVTLTATSYSYTFDEYKDKLDSNVLSMIKKSHWLANKSEALANSYVSYGMKCSSNGISGCTLYVAGDDMTIWDYKYYGDYEINGKYSLRPVVELKANIFGTKVEDTWKLN